MSIADKLTTIAENVPKVYEAGQKSEYDRFWDAYQRYGGNGHCGWIFSGPAWNNETFKPKHDIKPKISGYGIFWQSGIEGDLDEILNQYGVVLDTSECENFQNMFNSTKFTAIGEIVVSNKATNLANMFQQTLGLHYKTLKTIRLLKLRNDGGNTFSGTFSNCQGLENITIEGTIGNNLDIHWSPLTIESVLSVLTALTKDPTLASGKTATFKSSLRTAIEADPQCAEQIALAVNAGWTIGYA